jgi:hypothetical protein
MSTATAYLVQSHQKLLIAKTEESATTSYYWVQPQL